MYEFSIYACVGVIIWVVGIPPDGDSILTLT